MTELVTVEQADAVFRALIWVGPLLGALIGLAVGHLRERLLIGLGQGFAVGLLGPVLFGMWSLYSHTVRFDPETGVAGLHRVSVHALNALIFIAVGLVLGILYRRLVFPDLEERSAESDNTQVMPDDEVHSKQHNEQRGGAGAPTVATDPKGETNDGS